MSVVYHPVWGAETQKQDNGGHLSSPPVYLIFWGSYWGGSGTPQAQAIENAAADVLDSPCLGITQQYGSDGQAFYSGAVYDNSDPVSGKFDGVDDVIQKQIDNKALPEPDATGHTAVYCVVTPPGVGSKDPNAGGFNTSGVRFFGGAMGEIWVSMTGSNNLGPKDIDMFSVIFSHEMAEIMSDPGGSGFKVNAGATWPYGGDDQIGDCEPQTYRFREPNGALVQPFWSRADNAIVADNGTSQRFDLYPVWNGANFGGQYNLVVNGDQLGSPNDLIIVGRTKAGGVSITLNGENTSFEPGQINRVEINSGGGQDTIIVNATVAPTTITSSSPSNGPDDTILIGAGNTKGIVMPLKISNPTGYDVIDVSDAVDSAVSRHFTIADASTPGFGAITATGQADIYYAYDDTRSLFLETSSRGTNTVDVQTTRVPTTITGNSPANGLDDTINIGSGSSVQSIYSPLTLGNWTGHDVIHMDDGMDYTGRKVLLGNSSAAGFGSITGLAPAEIDYNFAQTRSIDLTLGVGGNTVNVYATGAPTTLFGGAAPQYVQGIPIWLGGSNTVNVGITNKLLGDLRIENSWGYDAINIDDSHTLVGRTITLDTTTPIDDPVAFGTVEGLVPAKISYEYDDTAKLTMTLGVGGNTVNVHATGVPTALLGGFFPIVQPLSAAASRVGSSGIGPKGLGGPNSIIVGDSGSTQAVHGDLTIENSYAQNTVVVDDSADGTPRTVTLGTAPPAGDSDPFGTITGICPATITYEAADTSSLTIDGGNAGNTFHVTDTPINLLDGSGGTAITLNAGAGDDKINVSGQGAGTTLTVDGQAGADTLEITGGGTADVFGVGAGQVTHGTSVVNYSDIEKLTLDPGTFTVTNDLGGIALTALDPGTVVNFEASQTLAALNIDGAVVTLDAGGNKTLSANALSISGGGTLDLRDNSLQLHYSGPDPMAAVRSWITSGRSGGSWAGAGITTGSSDATHGLGYADSADGVVAGLAADTILVKYARYGDVDLDGTVSFADLLAVARSYVQNPGNSNWDQGDVNYDGSVDFADLLQIARNYGMS